MSSPAPTRVALGVGLVAGCALALQVLLTRVLSAVLAYHFSFLAISLALLGVGAGALAVYLKESWAEGLEARLARWSALLAVLLVLMPIPLVRLDYSAGISTDLTASFAVTMALISVLVAIPFCVVGAIVALAVRGYAQSIGRVYAFDLAGAALGALACVPLLRVASGTTLLVGLAVLAAGAALLFGGAGRFAVGAAVVSVVAVALAATGSLYTLPPHTTAQGDDPISTRWTPLSRVLAYAPPGDAKIAPVFYDRIYAPVPVRRAGEPLPTWRELSLGPAERRLRDGGSGPHAGDRRRRRARHRERAQLRAEAGRRDRAQRCDP